MTQNLSYKNVGNLKQTKTRTPQKCKKGVTDKLEADFDGDGGKDEGRGSNLCEDKKMNSKMM